MKSLVSIILELAFIICLVSPVYAQQWNPQIVDAISGAGVSSQIAVTTDGTPYILYKIGLSDYLAWWVSTGSGQGGWNISPVPGISGCSSCSMEMVVDSYDNLHMRLGHHDYATFDSEAKSWLLTPEDFDPNAVLYFGGSDLTLIEHEGTIVPAIVYVTGTQGDTLKLATRDPDTGIWSHTLIPQGHPVTGIPSMAADSTGHLHISYCEAGPPAYLKYATNAPDGIWITEYVDVSANVGTYSSIVLDEGDIPYIVYYDSDNGDLKYAKLLSH